MPKPKDVEKFFSDPAHEDEANFFRAAVDKVLSEKVDAEKTRREKEGQNQPGILESIFGDLLK